MVRKLQDIQQCTRTVLKSGVYKSRDNLAVDCTKRTNSKVRLRGGKGCVCVPQVKLDSDITDIAPAKRKCRKQFCCPLKGNLNFFEWKACECLRIYSCPCNYDLEFNGNLIDIENMRNKQDVDRPIGIGIRNFPQTQYMPARFKKLIIPRNGTKLRCYTLKNITDLPKLSNTRRTFNIKKIFGDSDKKKIHSKFITELSRKRNILNGTTLENISRVSILLLYLHLLLYYYLSFSKTRFAKFFETCPIDDNES